MDHPPRSSTRITAVTVFLLLAGCQSAAPEQTIALTDTRTITLSASSTATETPTGTFTPTNTQTDTPTFTPTLPYNAPGKYKINKCIQYAYKGAPFSVLFCVPSVTVNNDSTMQFYVSWKIIAPQLSGIRVRKFSDSENRNMFLDDNLGNRYDHIGTGGCAAIVTYFSAGDTCNGWFLFRAAEPGATSFRFNDADNGVFIEDIVLLNEPPTPTITLTGTQKTPTPTSTPTPTITQTSTPTIDPNAVYNAPGTYWLYRCVPYPVTGEISGADSATLCLNTVVINSDGTMKFIFTWTMRSQKGVPIVKQPNSSNQNIYLLDDLQNEYHHVQTGGCAAEYFQQWNEIATCNGWFLFPPAAPGATSFQFVNHDLLVFINNIVLVKTQ